MVLTLFARRALPTRRLPEESDVIADSDVGDLATHRFHDP
jgi:hypothetical protein